MTLTIDNEEAFKDVLRAKLHPFGSFRVVLDGRLELLKFIHRINHHIISLTISKPEGLYNSHMGLSIIKMITTG